MINSSNLCVLVLLAFSVSGILGFSSPVLADNYSTETFTADQFIEYERQLNAMLKTRRDEEKEFVSQVVRQVRLGKIPSKLVSTSYGWVRTKRPETKYPFIYFEKVLRLQAEAAKLDEAIPRFNLSIYKTAGQNPFRARNSAGTRSITGRSVTPSAGRR